MILEGSDGSFGGVAAVDSRWGQLEINVFLADVVLEDGAGFIIEALELGPESAGYQEGVFGGCLVEERFGEDRVAVEIVEDHYVAVAREGVMWEGSRLVGCDLACLLGHRDQVGIDVMCVATISDGTINRIGGRGGRCPMSVATDSVRWRETLVTLRLGHEVRFPWRMALSSVDFVGLNRHAWRYLIRSEMVEVGVTMLQLWCVVGGGHGCDGGWSTAQRPEVLRWAVTTQPWSVKVPTDRRAWLARFGNMWPVLADAGRGSRPGRVQVGVHFVGVPGRRVGEASVALA
eukprot:scaffold3668_cov97-Cylindrotheca_fusiformis.AAC.5